MNNQTSKGKLSVPMAIIIAGLIVAGVLYFTNSSNNQGQKTDTGQEAEDQAGSPTDQKTSFRPVTDDDHIKGNRNAPITIIEYSDLECPFCKRFHPTMQQVIDEYPGQVRWVYRHFPLTQLHSKAAKEAEATECAAELGGNEGFWAYVDRLYEITPANNGLDFSQLPQIAEYVGLDRDEFEQCLNSGKYADKVQADVDDAVAAGGRGTPYSLIIDQDGNTSTIPGALPFEQVKAMIEPLL